MTYRRFMLRLTTVAAAIGLFWWLVFVAIVGWPPGVVTIGIALPTVGILLAALAFTLPFRLAGMWR